MSEPAEVNPYTKFCADVPYRNAVQLRNFMQMNGFRSFFTELDRQITSKLPMTSRCNDAIPTVEVVFANHSNKRRRVAASGPISPARHRSRDRTRRCAVPLRLGRPKRVTGARERDPLRCTSRSGRMRELAEEYSVHLTELPLRRRGQRASSRGREVRGVQQERAWVASPSDLKARGAAECRYEGHCSHRASQP